MKFITDETLGTLAKWLRILGFDTLFYHDRAGRALLTKAGREGRIVLTRKRDMAGRQFSGKMLVLIPDQPEKQLNEVMNRLSIGMENLRLFSRCIRCNRSLNPIEKEAVGDRVPPYVFETQNDFMICPVCRRIFWPGTHRVRAEEWLRSHILRDRP